MSKPLTGTKKQTATGWHASLPIHRGATKRQPYTFRTEYAADRWLAAGRAAIAAGEPLPKPADTDLAVSATPSPSWSRLWPCSPSPWPSVPRSNRPCCGP